MIKSIVSGLLLICLVNSIEALPSGTSNSNDNGSTLVGIQKSIRETNTFLGNLPELFQTFKLLYQGFQARGIPNVNINKTVNKRDEEEKEELAEVALSTTTNNDIDADADVTSFQPLMIPDDVTTTTTESVEFTTEFELNSNVINRNLDIRKESSNHISNDFRNYNSANHINRYSGEYFDNGKVYVNNENFVNSNRVISSPPPPSRNQIRRTRNNLVSLIVAAGIL